MQKVTHFESSQASYPTLPMHDSEPNIQGCDVRHSLVRQAFPVFGPLLTVQHT